MFKNDYQGGPCFELLTLQGKESSAHWKFSGGVKKVYDKEVKSFIYSLEGTPSTTKVHYPKDQSQAVPLIQRYIVIQLHLAKGQDLSIELGVADLGNNKRRLHFSTAQKETQVTPLHAKIPLTILRRSIWLNMCIDMVSLVGETWKGQTYKATQSISVSANCKLRRIFTMKIQPPDTAGDEEMYGCPPSNSGELDQIPKSCQLANDVQQITQLLTLTKIRHGERLRAGSGDVNRASATLELDLNSSGRRTSLNDSYHIAFGSKVLGCKSTSQNSSRKSAQGSMTSRSTRNTYSRMDSQTEDMSEEHLELSSSITSKDGLLSGSDHSREDSTHQPSHQRQGSDSLSQVDLEMMSRIDKPKQDFPIVQPHPPREPSNDRLRRKIRVKAGGSGVGKDRVSSAGSVTDESMNSGPGKHSQQHSESSSSSHKSSTASHRKRLVSDGELILTEGSENTADSANRNKSAETPRGIKAQGIPKVSDRLEGRTGNRFKGVGASGQDPHDRLSPKASKEYNCEDYQEEGVEMMDDSMSAVIELLKQKAGLGGRMGQDWDELTDEEESSAEDLGREEYEESDEEESDNRKMFMFAVPPKSAPRRHLSPSQADSGLELDSSSQSRTLSLSRNSRKISKESARGARPEEDFFNNNTSSDDDDVHVRIKLGGSRPNSGTNSRPHSGTNSRPHSGTTSRPHSGTNSRPHSGTNSGTNSRNHSGTNRSGTNNLAVSPKSGVEKKVPRTVLNPVQPQIANESPELRFSSNTSVLQVPGINNGHLSKNSISRMSRKSLREIPMNDARLKSSEKPYDFSKYQMADITESFEAKMLSSMKRHNDEELEDVVESPRKQTAPIMPPSKSPHSTQEHNPRNLYDFSPTLTSDDDTSLSTWQAPPNAPHNYQDEMKSRLSTDTLTSSNPRDWGMFSPPLPVFQSQLKSSNEDFSIGSNNPSPRKEPSDLSPRKAGLSAVGCQDTTDDESIEELDLLYDPCLNCYYDPRSCKYYELV
ncbi:protein CFAP20DC-like [Ylistrum balloti]|uniref:protein CFAP20DC-like n=1 Tax=Ylistrum balloti TaxID=509963 RepID=UPI002905CA5C|nr:protein CFAP20DC-like [Ylistrum balloti]